MTTGRRRGREPEPYFREAWRWWRRHLPEIIPAAQRVVRSTVSAGPRLGRGMLRLVLVAVGVAIGSLLLLLAGPVVGFFVLLVGIPLGFRAVGWIVRGFSGD